MLCIFTASLLETKDVLDISKKVK